ncbi:transposase [Ferrimonas sp. SCSIO 43195]|uniref:transposase n=1 Tax=Ferrimonas sp. SCSIO 43195 TaxID=2822844 RepID=UPI003530BB60
MAELGDLRRFSNPRQLMNFIGLTPSERSSGQREKRGGGNTHARCILIEAAWANRFSPKVSRELQVRQQHHSVTLQQRS